MGDIESRNGFKSRYWRYYVWLQRQYKSGKDLSKLSYEEFLRRGRDTRKRKKDAADHAAKKRASQS